MGDKKPHGGARPNSGLPKIEEGKKYFLVLRQMYEGDELPPINAGDR
jgi:hypothetical protein